MRLSTILKDYGLKLEETKLVRHPLNKKDIREIYSMGGLNYIEVYKAYQSNRIFDNCRYVVSFLGTVNAQAKFIGVYKVNGVVEESGVRKYMPAVYLYE